MIEIALVFLSVAVAIMAFLLYMSRKGLIELEKENVTLVDTVLAGIDVAAEYAPTPGEYTACVYLVCPHCGCKSIITKDEDAFTCSSCEAEMSLEELEVVAVYCSDELNRFRELTEEVKDE